MAFSGCDKCGTVINTYRKVQVTVGGSRCWPCPECGRPMRSVSVGEAIELARERAEAEQWRGDANAGGDAAQTRVTA
jgi:RNase P subunit RPR2